MTRHPLVSFLIGLFVSGLISCIVVFIWLFATLDVGGGEPFDEVKYKAGVLLLSITLLLIVSIALVRFYVKAGKKALALGIIFFPVTAFIISVAHYNHYLDHHITFDKTTWDTSTPKPLDMTVSLWRENKLDGLTKADIEAMLGTAVENEGEGPDHHGASYFIENNWILVVYFDNGKVGKTILRRPWLSV